MCLYVTMLNIIMLTCSRTIHDNICTCTIVYVAMGGIHVPDLLLFVDANLWSVSICKVL